MVGLRALSEAAQLGQQIRDPLGLRDRLGRHDQDDLGDTDADEARDLVDEPGRVVAVGVTEIILIVAGDPVAQAERLAARLPELRGLDQGA